MRRPYGLGGALQEINLNASIDLAFDALSNDRLAVLCGAGLSMAPPSSLPSAATLAQRAKQKYDAQFGVTRGPLPPAIEDQAEFFFERDELQTVFLRRLIDHNAFAAPSNAGHVALADLLIVNGIKTAVTTNVDFLIEAAGQRLFGHVGAGIDGDSVARLLPDVAPLLKLHGCRQIDPDNTVWAKGQISAPPVSDRIASSTAWLEPRLLDRDLVVVGFSTDWDYLNDILGKSLGAVRPTRVLIVDPADPAGFQAKAPNLFQLGQRAKVSFSYLRQSGSEFLSQLRWNFSNSIVRQVLHCGSQAFEDATGQAPTQAILEPPSLDNETLWQIRRDLEGKHPNEPSLARHSPQEPLLGATLLQLRHAGAAADGPFWLMGNQRVRVLKASNEPLHRIEAAFERGIAPSIAPDITIAVGAERQQLAANVARATTASTIARGNKTRWVTRLEAIAELNI